MISLDTIDRLLSSNCIPGPSEAGTIQEVVDRLKKQVSSLRNRLEECEEELRKHQSVLSAVRRIPVDVLGVIFGFALPADCLNEDGRAQVADLSLVCRLWFEAARSVHRFWSSHQVRYTDLDYDRVVRWFSHSNSTRRTLWIRREVDAGCSLHQHRDLGKGSGCISASLALARLLAEGPTLNQLRIGVYALQCLQHLLNALASHGGSHSPWDKVKSLTLDIPMEEWDTPASSKPIEGIPPCITALNLEYLGSIMLFDYGKVVRVEPSVLERLTSLSLSGMWTADNGGAVLAALSHCTNLEAFTFNFVGAYWVCPEGSSAVELPKLHTLRLSRPVSNFEFLNYINTPALIQLDVYITFSPPEPGSLEAFIQKMSAVQDNFRVCLHFAESYTPDKVIDFLRHVPKVSHLTLEDPTTKVNLGDSLFDKLLDIQPEETLLADLEVLEILELPAQYDLSTVRWYIKSRPPHDKFKRLIVKYGKMGLPASYTYLGAIYVKEIQERGVSVDITHPELYTENELRIYDL